MVNDKLYAFSNTNSAGRSLISKKSDRNSISETKDKNQDKWSKELIARLLRKSKSIEQYRRQILKLADGKNALAVEVKQKDDEIRKSNDKILLLTRELSVLKDDYLKALGEIKLLKFQVQESARKNEIVEQKKTLYKKMEKELEKSKHLLVEEKLKTQNLERMKVHPHEWRVMQHAEPYYYEMLQKKNRMQKELQKKLDLVQAKDAQLQQKNALLKDLEDILKRRPFNLTKDPTEQMMEYSRTIQSQREKIKSLTAQLNMLESVFSDKYHKMMGTVTD